MATRSKGDLVPVGNSPEEDRPSVGRALNKARIDARLTVDEVSASTRVRVPIVRGIEDDDFSRCGGDVYARGHIRALARAVGLDGTELVEQFDEEHGGRPEPTPAAALFEAERTQREPRRPNWTAAMAAAIVAVVGFVVFTLVSDGGQSSDTPVAGDATSDSPGRGKSDKPEPSRSADKKPEPSESAVAGVPGDKVTVRMVAEKGNSWLSVEGHSGKLLFEGSLREGATKTFNDDKRLDLVLGNAGAMKLWVNGKEVDRLGEEGKVERVSYTRGDPEQG